MKQKATLFLFTFCFLLCMFLFYASNACAHTIYWSHPSSGERISSLSISPGRQIHLLLKAEVPENKILKAYNVKVTYDHILASLLKAEKPAGSSFPPTNINSNIPGEINLNGFDSSGVSGPATIAFLDVTLNAAISGTFILGIKVNNFGSSSSDNFPPTEEASQIVIEVTLPNLVIQSLAAVPQDPTTSDDITFTAIIKNIGTATAGASKAEFAIREESNHPKYDVPELAPEEIYTLTKTENFEDSWTYRLTVTADIDGEVAESDESNNVKSIDFTVAPEPCTKPDTPSCISPANNATGISLTPTLESSDFSDPDSGDTHKATQWQLDDNNDFSSPVWDYEDTDSDKTSEPIPSGKLNYATKYYWRVRYQDNHDAWSDWADYRDFTSELCPVPGTPTNPSPSNGGTNVSINNDLDWSDCANTDSYDVYFGTSSTPPYYGNTTSSSYNLPALNPCTTYHWNIVAKNSCGNSTSGSIWSFTTADPAPTKPYQIVSINPNVAMVTPCGNFKLIINYNVSNGNNKLSGLGINIHFDSSKLNYVNYTNFLDKGDLKSPPTLTDDINDEDNDPSTNKIINMSWASFSSQWPDMTLPAVLTELNFTMNCDLPIGQETLVNISSFEKDANYDFIGNGSKIIVNPCSLDIDDNGETKALTDGLLIMRYLFRYPSIYGDAWIDGVIAPDCERCTAAEIKSYVEGFINSFDVDDNGETKALTDGLLIMRYLFRYPSIYGDAWIDGVVAPDCKRCNAQDIENYISSQICK